ncbi:MAG: PD40 domain-containing protein [Anaerolineaceae bacterium]|nr:PD40 domain-containing protein [Anaerolineaceae bacterium]
MSETTKTDGIAITRFDLLIGGTIALVVLATIVLAVLSDPGRQGAMIAYLAPYTGGSPNIWVAPVDEPENARQLSDVTIGVFDFDVSANGKFIAYAARDGESLFNDIYVVNIQTGQTERITSCQEEEADCTTPAFRAAGDLIAYARVDTNISVPGVGPGAQRIWLVDIRQKPYLSQPLSGNSQIIGHSPQWSADGRSIVFFSSDIGNPGVMFYTYAPQIGQQSLLLLPSEAGDIGTLSADGSKLVYPVFGDGINNFNRVLQLIDTTSPSDNLEPITLTLDDPSIDDATADFHPDGTRLVIERRYVDGDLRTMGYQLYEMAIDSGLVTPLVVDAHYQHGLAEWDKTGEQIVFQRVRLENDDGTPAIRTNPEAWVLNVTSSDLIQISDNGFLPQWVQP